MNIICVHNLRYTRPMSDRRLTTERLILRKPSRGDAQYIWKAGHTPGFTEGMLWNPPKDFEEIYRFTDKAIASFEKGTSFAWSVETKEGDFVGRVNLRPADKPSIPNAWTMGYWTLPEMQGRGYATEAAMAVLDFAFREAGVDAIEITHAKWNEASAKVVRKMGLTHIGYVEDKVIKNGQPRGSEVYVIEKRDWMK